jgi:hypothetical protein
MSSKNGTRRAQRKKTELEPDLSVQYRKIGIKAVAAAVHQEAKEPAAPSGDQKAKKRAREKASG